VTRQAATYRLQLEPGFDLHEARRHVPYLARLGITHVYLSPVLEARAGSTHGYDVTDPGRVRAELGGMEAFVALADAAAEHGMSLLLDIVPNHMAAAEENPAWRDVLRRGAASPYARWFDLSWHTSPEPFPIPLPVLGAPLEDVLAASELALGVEDGGVVVTYFERRFPCSPEGVALMARSTGGQSDAARDTTAEAEAAGMADTAGAGGPTGIADTAGAGDPADAARLVARFDALPAADRTRMLRELLELQHYSLRFWRSCAGVVGYRRFFDIDDLVSVRVEDPAVFDAVHAGLDRCLAHPAVAGVRVDHVDGLLDPAGYLRRLRALLDAHRPDAWLLVEKILAPDERLPADWPVDGTTGYEFLVTLNGLLVSEAGGRALQALHGRLTGMRVEPTDMALARKRQVLERLFSGELDLLARELTALREGVPVPAADPALREALAEASVRMEVYRTYVRGTELSAEDRRRVEAALGAAEEALAGQSAAGTLPFLRAVLLLDANVLGRRLRPALAFVQRWQQLTGPLMAKGYEDTALYRYSALAAGSDVGAELDRPWTPPAEVHAFLAGRAAAPRTLNTTSTHDTKRSEDVRARLDVLAELPDDWAAAVEGWTGTIEGWTGTTEGSNGAIEGWNAPAPGSEPTVAGRPNAVPGLRPGVERSVPAPALDDTVYLLLQIIVGTWPLHGRVEEAWLVRLRAYAVKAAREAKARTSWRDPDPQYEEALQAMLTRLLTHPDHADFRREAGALAARTAAPGALGSLAQLLIKATAPGTPDLYRGSELWRYDLVDPDNRRPVDFAARARLLTELEPLVRAPRAAGVAALVDDWRSGALKLYVTRAALAWRARHAAFAGGDYTPLEAVGPAAQHLFAFQRGSARGPVTVAPRLMAFAVAMEPAVRAGVWEGTSLEMEGAWRNALTGEEAGSRGGRLALAPLLATLPLALLEPA